MGRALRSVMDSARALLLQFVESQSVSRRQFAKELQWQHTHLSKVLLGELEVSRTVMARILPLLDEEAGERFLHAYLNDEIVRLQGEARELLAQRAAKPKAAVLLDGNYVVEVARRRGRK